MDTEIRTRETEQDSVIQSGWMGQKMQPDFRLPDFDVPTHEGHELDAFLGKAFEEKPIWKTLYESIHDKLFPPQLPPLELTSKPIPVPDRMAQKMSPAAVALAAVVNCSIAAVLIFLVGRAVVNQFKKPQFRASILDVSDVNATKMKFKMGGGGGGGSHELVDASKGKTPPVSKNPIVAPMIPVLDKPKLAIDPAIKVQDNVKLPDNPDMTNFGVKSSPNITLASNGRGSDGGIGSGTHGGDGPGNGIGYGPGSNWNTGNGIEHVGGGVSAPVPTMQPDAEFSDEARRAKYQGVCLVGLIVDAQGNPQGIHIVRSLGMGLDQKALEAVRRYRFRPAMKGGKPVAVPINIEVNFRLL